MALVLTNGTYYIYTTPTKKIKKTNRLSEARKFNNPTEAFKMLNRASAKTQGYYLFNSTKQRRLFSETEKEYIYNKSNGCCQLCGNRIFFKEMTLDHIKPLGMGGSNAIDNIQCTCKACNRFKANILPELFNEKITKIFMYQMDKEHGKKMYWKICKKLLLNIID